MIAPDRIRNALAKLVVECADASNARRRSGPKAEGWLGAGVALGIPFCHVKRACTGESIHPRTLARIHDALVRTGRMRSPGNSIAEGEKR